MSRNCRWILVVGVAIVLAVGSAGGAIAEAKGGGKKGGAKQGKNAASAKVPNKSFDELDKDHNDNLSMHEIFGATPKKGTAARTAFEKADRDHNDWITRSEFQDLQRIAKNGGKGGAKGDKKGGGAKKAGSGRGKAKGGR